jgi:hypothetical protein
LRRAPAAAAYYNEVHAAYTRENSAKRDEIKISFPPRTAMLDQRNNIYLFYLKTDNVAAGNTGQKTATIVYPVKNKQSYVQY